MHCWIVYACFCFQMGYSTSWYTLQMVLTSPTGGMWRLALCHWPQGIICQCHASPSCSGDWTLQSVFGMMLVLQLTETWAVLASHLSHLDIQESNIFQGCSVFTCRGNGQGGICSSCGGHLEHPTNRHHSAVVHQLERKGPVGIHWAQLAVHLVIRNTVLFELKKKSYWTWRPSQFVW